MRIAVVGNAPLSHSSVSLIDGHDLVLWFNRAKEFGLLTRRIDVLVLGNSSLLNQHSTNCDAYEAAKEIWMLGDNAPALAKPLRFIKQDDRLESALIDWGASGRVKPSAGARVIAHLLSAQPDAELSLFGFSHVGDQRHPWAAERRWCDALVNEGRVKRVALADPLEMRIHASALRLFRRGARNLEGLVRRASGLPARTKIATLAGVQSHSEPLPH